MRLTVDRHLEGLQATVTIDRAGGNIETLTLTPAVGNPHAFISSTTPSEPHEFEAQLHLKVGDRKVVLPFWMVEPEGPS